MNKKKWKKLAIVTHAAWLAERDEYLAANRLLLQQRDAAERKRDAWELEARTLKRESRSESEHRS